MTFVAVERERIVLANVDGAFYALRDVCGHRNAPLSKGRLDGCVIECPLHFAQFDVRTGKLIDGPISADVPAYEVRVDAITLFERLEAKLEQYSGQLTRACVELAKDWRTDRYLRRLEAMMAVADKEVSLILSGTGDVLEPEDGIIGIGSGGGYALAAARALIEIDGIDAETVARRALAIAGQICVYTNDKITLEKLTI